MNTTGFKYNPLGILGTLEYDMADITSAGTSEGVTVGTLHISAISELPETSATIPMWAYPYQFNVVVTREELRKIRTKCLLGMTPCFTVSIQFEPY